MAITYRGERFSGYNKPKNARTKSKKFAVLAKSGMNIKKSNPARRKSFRARHKCSTATNKLSARYWSCKKW